MSAEERLCTKIYTGGGYDDVRIYVLGFTPETREVMVRVDNAPQMEVLKAVVNLSLIDRPMHFYQDRWPFYATIEDGVLLSARPVVSAEFKARPTAWARQTAEAARLICFERGYSKKDADLIITSADGVYTLPRLGSGRSGGSLAKLLELVRAEATLNPKRAAVLEACDRMHISRLQASSFIDELREQPDRYPDAAAAVNAFERRMNRPASMSPFKRISTTHPGKGIDQPKTRLGHRSEPMTSQPTITEQQEAAFILECDEYAQSKGAQPISSAALGNQALNAWKNGIDRAVALNNFKRLINEKAALLANAPKNPQDKANEESLNEFKSLTTGRPPEPASNDVPAHRRNAALQIARERGELDHKNKAHHEPLRLLFREIFGMSLDESVEVFGVADIKAKMTAHYDRIELAKMDKFDDASTPQYWLDDTGAMVLVPPGEAKPDGLKYGPFASVDLAKQKQAEIAKPNANRIASETPPATPPANDNSGGATPVQGSAKQTASSEDGGGLKLVGQAATITTLTGIPIGKLQQAFNREYGSDAYDKIKMAGGRQGTSIKQVYMRDRFERIFGPHGIGWKIEPHDVLGSITCDWDEAQKKFVVTMIAHVFKYAVMMPSGEMQWISLSPMSDCNSNVSKGYAYRGAFTSFLKQVLKLFGGMNHFMKQKTA